MVNRITPIVRRNSHNKAVTLLDEVGTGATELTSAEKEKIVEYLCSNGRDAPLYGLFWLIAACLPAEPRLLEQARVQVMGREPGKPAYQSECSAAVLQYLLINETTGVRETLIGYYSIQPSVRSRETVADRLVAIGRTEEGLRVMVHILLDVGTDHATADSIAMNMTYCGNPEIKAIFLAEAAQIPDKDLQRNFELVAGLMYDEVPEPYRFSGGPAPTMEELLRDLDELARSFPMHTHDRRFFSLAHVELTGYRAKELTHGVLRQLHESFKWMKYTVM